MLQNRFNEAGAINPGKRRTAAMERENATAASMRPGQLTPENLTDCEYAIRHLHGCSASMRPGQLTPENCVKLESPGPRPIRRAASFNEAGAINPGKPIPAAGYAGRPLENASMRPGQLTPENV